MKTIKLFQMGSSYFFNDYEDYNLKDNDELHVLDEWKFPKTNGLIMTLKNPKTKKDIFYIKNTNKKEYIDDVIESKVYMRVGKFLIPEFNEYIGFTIDDLKSIMYLFDSIDEKHTYEKIIAESYIENNGFFLTKEQRDRAYDDYKRARLEKEDENNEEKTGE